MLAQYIINGLLIGSLYACLAVGFSLVWGVLNIINMLHGAFVVLGAYIVIFGVQSFGGSPILWTGVACIILFAIGYLVQLGLINKVVAAPIFITFTLTFGMDLLAQNLMINVFTATPRSLTIGYGSLQIAGLSLSVARLIAMGFALLLTGLLYWLLKHSSIGRAIVAVRMDRHAATLLGLDVPRIYAVTFGIGALMAAAGGGAMAMAFPITPVLDGTFLGKAFVICVLGGLGSVPGALIGGLVLGLLESFGAVTLGSQWSATVGFVIMLAILVFRPAGIAGRSGFE
ncbi:MAG TPA: branched-chain amino acid ABC transporter permease [Pseudolabrys sp.]|jgi:branched-chain amino acid transport system permease protein|uniref:branched-chain amino acid ABC transporter permease n=1 Tax=Pseudolabrys sp. TaxID=1960880 RepID=UPI002DDD0B9E|nr:branched-chain amino acid ABC transporter permease [Pseudolabrys sp.]HEV2629203.1 branched-chain amino acid ABC transporter permease [Pseudolabrys sp.]